MDNKKYYFDKSSLSYKEITTSKVDKLKNISVYILLSLFFGGMMYVFTFNFVESPKEKILRRELEHMTTKYDDISLRVGHYKNVLENIQERDNNIYRVFLKASPIDKETRQGGFGGINMYDDLLGYDNSDMIIKVSREVDILAKQLYIQSKSFDEVVDLAKEKKKMLASLPAIQPISNKSLTRLASGFGIRWHPIFKMRKMHYGMDFTAKTGTPIYATGNGVIKKVSNHGSYGKHVIISHGFGYESLYAHMSKHVVKKGQKIKRGTIIGYVGNTGLSAGPHLHYEIMFKGKKVNPVGFYSQDLTPKEFEIVSKLASQENQSYD